MMGAAGEKNRPDLDEYGILNLFGEITGDSAGSLCRQIIQINVEGKLNKIQILINSGGGDCHAGFALLDIMEWSRIPIATTGIGLVSSIALLVFMAGQRGSRVLTHGRRSCPTVTLPCTGATTARSWPSGSRRIQSTKR